MCITLVSYREETGLHGGDFWITVFHEYASRTGPVRDAVEATMNWWLRYLETVVSASIELEQITPCDPAQLAFEVQALLSAAAHQYRLVRDPKATARGKSAVWHRLQARRGPRFPALAE
jgi:hypothetical protein